MSSNTDYRRKIKTQRELLEIIGPRPREGSVIMCHGTFDLVHPGHVRHLLYAKSKADVLVASLTSDEHISKADYRPYVPEQLRAMNLAALEVVDWVVIDRNPTPIESLLVLQPDFFAKGYEYIDGKPGPKTQEEIDTLNIYGGEMIFTPGDVVFSSSEFIEHVKPDIVNDKLQTLMESEEVTPESLVSTLKGLKGVKVQVLGDTIVDTYIYCNVIGSGTSKTPTLSVKYDREVNYIGGAAIVAQHLRAAGADVRFTTVLGDDPLKDYVLNELEKSGVQCDAAIDTTRVTTQKNVIIAQDYRLLKLDKVDNQPISDRTLEQFKLSLASSDAEAVVFSDFRHGIFNRGTISQFTNVLPTGVLRVADTQMASRWGNIVDFQGFDLITPNEREARFALGDQDSVIRPLAQELFKQTQCKTLILKLGDRGILTYREPTRENPRGFFVIDSLAYEVVDPVGAGDALLAYSTLSLAVSGSPVQASILGSLAAAVACERDGNIPVSPIEVGDKLKDLSAKVINI